MLAASEGPISAFLILARVLEVLGLLKNPSSLRPLFFRRLTSIEFCLPGRHVHDLPPTETCSPSLPLGARDITASGSSSSEVIEHTAFTD